MNIEAVIDQVHVVYPDILFSENEPLKNHTSFKSGGNSLLFTTVETVDQLKLVVMTAWKEKIPLKVIGGGTSIVASEKGFDGLVVKNNCHWFDLQGMKGRYSNRQMKLSQAFLYAESGALTNRVVRFVIDQGFGGIEFCLGLPGTLGGAVAVNASYPKEDIRIGRAVYAAKILTKDGVSDVDASYFHFGFESSVLLSQDVILLSVLFALYPDDKSRLWQRADEAVRYRIANEPKNHLGVGQTFRNIRFRSVYPNSGLPADISLRELCTKAGILGKRIGGVGSYKEDPHYFLNYGEARAEDFLTLVREIKATIFRKFGVQLELKEHMLS